MPFQYFCVHLDRNHTSVFSSIRITRVMHISVNLQLMWCWRIWFPSVRVDALSYVVRRSLGISDSWSPRSDASEEVSQEVTEEISFVLHTWKGLWKQGSFSLSFWLGGRFGWALRPTQGWGSLSENKLPLPTGRDAHAAGAGVDMSKDERKRVV